MYFVTVFIYVHSIGSTCNGCLCISTKRQEKQITVFDISQQEMFLEK